MSPHPSGTALATADAVLLDMDGTLVNSEKSVVACWDRLFAELGSDAVYEESFHGQPARSLLRRVFPEMSEADLEAAYATVERYEIETADSVEVLPGTREFLADLEAASSELGREVWTIVTSCTRRLFTARYAHHGLPIPDTLVTADQVTHGKPNPEPYLRGAERLGVSADQCIVAEDAVPGLEAGLASGAFTLGVTTTSDAEAIEALADVRVGSLADVSVRVEDGRLALVVR
ncbi:MAG: HAD-IA family hydrolase [Dermabacter sp.]|nr:HAD-IA family hydrolase [Dermabacter sp.]